MDKSEIVNCLKSHIAEVASHRPVLLAYLYGSVAKDQATPLSDVDVALLLEDDLTPLEQHRTPGSPPPPIPWSST